MARCYGDYNLLNNAMEDGCDGCALVLPCIDETADIQAELDKMFSDVWTPTIEEEEQMYAATWR